MEIGDSIQLKVKNISKKRNIKWSSDDPVVATVSAEGIVTAKLVGTVKVTAKVNGKKYTCKVTVIEKSLGIYDGDIYYTAPSDYRTKKSDITYGETKTLTYYSTTTEK